MAGNIAASIIIGGTNTSIGLIGSDRQVIAAKHILTHAKDGFESFCARTLHELRCLFAERETCDTSPRGLGIGATGPVDHRTGIVLTNATLPGWKGFSFIEEFERRLKIPVRVENNADAALLGEITRGELAGFSKILLVTFGTGVGGAVFYNGALFRGSQSAHPEIGHIPAAKEGAICDCGQSGCLESIASGTAIKNLAQTNGFKDARDILDHFRLKEAKACALLKPVFNAVESAALTFCHTLLPEAVVLGGGIIDQHFDLFAHVVNRGFARATFLPKVPLVISARRGNESGLIGAASLVLDQPTSSASLPLLAAN